MKYSIMYIAKLPVTDIQLASRPQVLYSGIDMAIPTLQCMFKTPSRVVRTVAHDLVSLNNFRIKYR